MIVIPAKISRRRRASVIPLENGIQVKGAWMDPGFPRGDDSGNNGVERKSTSSRQGLESLGLEPRDVSNIISQIL
jgi:hypothetical protein